MQNKKLLFIVFLYLCITIYAISMQQVWYTHFLNPLFWIGMTIYLIENIKNENMRMRRNKTFWIPLMVMIFINLIIYFFMGCFFGFSKSPYSHKISSIFKNMMIQVFPVIGLELTRAVLVVSNQRNRIVRMCIPILFVLLEINYYTVWNVYAHKEAFFKYICSTVFPLIANSLLYTYLALKDFYLVSIFFRTFKILTILLSPILPNIDWFITGSISILLAVCTYVLFAYEFCKPKIKKRRCKTNQKEKMSLMITIIFCMIFVCFMAGVFAYEPIVILSNSMDQTYSRGDVIIFKKINEKALKEIEKGEVIIYRVEEQNIAHRVVNIIRENHTIQYQTKGDNNEKADANLVKIDQILGVYQFHVKYVGFPAVWLYEFFNHENPKVET